MQIYFEKIGWRYRRNIRKVVSQALKFTDNDLPMAVVTFSFMNEKEIKYLNNKSRNVDKVTDVLSFPMLEMHYGESLKSYIKEVSPDGNLYIGDVVICPQKAKSQAKEYGHSMKREVAFLALHGLLHLLGYDHIKHEDEVVMMHLTTKILNSLKIERK